MKENHTGKNIYKELKKNTTIIWAIVIVSFVAIISMLFFSLSIYQSSSNKIYTINNKGNLIPLSLISEKEDRVKVIQASVEYFVKQYFELDQYNLKDRKEKTLWLIGEQPTKILKDKDRKGYYSNFMTINGLIQKAEIVQDSWQIADVEGSPQVSLSIIIERVNGQNKEYYQNDINLRLTKVNINYPYNPFGFLVTNYAEQLQRIPAPTEDQQKASDTLQVKTQIINTK